MIIINFRTTCIIRFFVMTNVNTFYTSTQISINCITRNPARLFISHEWTNFRVYQSSNIKQNRIRKLLPMYNLRCKASRMSSWQIRPSTSNRKIRTTWHFASIFVPGPPAPFDDILPHVFAWASCWCCLTGCACVCPEVCDCGWGCWTGCGCDGGGIDRWGCNSRCWEVGAFACDNVELGGAACEVTTGGVSVGFSFVLPHPPPPLGTKETVGSLPEFSLFKDGRFAGGGIRRLAPTFPRLWSPWRAAPWRKKRVHFSFNEIFMHKK